MRRVWLGVGIGGLLVAGGLLAWRAAMPRTAAEEPADEPAVVSVKTAVVQRATLRGYVPAAGRVEPRQATAQAAPASARIAAPVAGIVAEIHCAEGQHVTKGTVLFRLDSRVADVAVDRARQAVAFAEVAFDRQKKLGPGEATSERLYLEAEQNLALARSELRNAETQRALLSIAAPLDGTVVRVMTRPGDAADLTSTLAEIIDLSRLVITATVRSSDVSRLSVGQSVEFWTGAAGAPAPQAEPAGRSTLAYIGPDVDAKNDAVLVRASVPPGSRLRPGEFVNLRIVAEERRDRLAAPAESVVADGAGTVIAVITGDRAHRLAVTVGLRDGDLIEIAGAGVSAGMTIVSAGAYGLPDGSRVRVIGP